MNLSAEVARLRQREQSLAAENLIIKGKLEEKKPEVVQPREPKQETGKDEDDIMAEIDDFLENN